MLNDLTCFAAVPGAEQERFQQLFEAASYKFRQRFAAPTRARPSAASGGCAAAAVAHGLPLDPPRGRVRPARLPIVLGTSKSMLRMCALEQLGTI